MKVYEYGEEDNEEGMYWSGLALSNEQSFEAIKTAIVAKFELNLSLTTEALDEHDDEDYINGHLEQREYDKTRLNLARHAKIMMHLCRIDRVFVRQREVAEYVGCDYWSLLAAKEIAEKTNA